jgi:hypothetical protein
MPTIKEEKIQLFKETFNEGEILNIKTTASKLAARFFEEKLSNAQLNVLFTDFKNQFDDYLINHQNKITSAQAFYYYFQKSIISNITEHKPNPLTFEVFSNDSISTESKKLILAGLKFGAPNHENESYLDYYFRKIIPEAERHMNSEFNHSHWNSFDNLKFEIYLDIFSNIIDFSGFDYKKEKEARIEEFLNLFKEKDFLTQDKDSLNEIQMPKKKKI